MMMVLKLLIVVKVLMMLMVLMTTMIVIHDYNGKVHDGGLMIHDA